VLSSLTDTLPAALLLLFFVFSLLVKGLSWEELTNLLTNFLDGSTESSSELLLEEDVILGVLELSLDFSGDFDEVSVSSASSPVDCLTFELSGFVSGSSAR